MAISGLLSNAWLLYLVFRPDTTPAQSNAVIACIGSITVLISAFMGFELNKDARTNEAFSQSAARITEVQAHVEVAKMQSDAGQLIEADVGGDEPVPTNTNGHPHV